MPLLNFKKRFVEHIRSGRKHHTIRANRKFPIQPGDPLYLYCGARTKSCFKILEQPQPCTRALPLYAWLKQSEEITSAAIMIDGNELGSDELQSLAHHDGFESWEEMRTFWIGRYPFQGQIIHWK